MFSLVFNQNTAYFRRYVFNIFTPPRVLSYTTVPGSLILRDDGKTFMLTDVSPTSCETFFSLNGGKLIFFLITYGRKELLARKKTKESIKITRAAFFFFFFNRRINLH